MIDKEVTCAEHSKKELAVNDPKADYNGIPIINHTEAEVEYFETLIFLKNSQTGKAGEKIVRTDERFKQLVTHAFFMTEESKEIGEKIVRLREELGV